MVPWTRGLPGTLRPEYRDMTAGPPEPEALWVRDLVRLVEKYVEIPVIGVTMGKSTEDARYFQDPWEQ